MHLKINLRDDYEEPVYNKQLVEAQIGFRRLLCRPTYSVQIGDTDKYKVCPKLEKGASVIASIYSQLSFPETPVIILRPNSESPPISEPLNTKEIINSDFANFKGIYQMKQIAIGKTLASDCNKIIIKRKVITGYPLKIHKRRAVVRYMFF